MVKDSMFHLEETPRLNSTQFIDCAWIVVKATIFQAHHGSNFDAKLLKKKALVIRSLLGTAMSDIGESQHI